MVVEVSTQEKEGSSVYEAAVVLESAKGMSLEAHLKLWVDVDKQIYMPAVDVLYQLDAKVTKSEDKTLCMEAMRFCPVSGELTKVCPPFVFGTASHEGTMAEDNAVVRSSTYANGLKSDVEVDCQFSAKQYNKFMAKVKKGQETFVCGILADLDSHARIHLINSHFSFLGKSKAAMNSEENSVPTVSVSTSEAKGILFSPRKRTANDDEGKEHKGNTKRGISHVDDDPYQEPNDQLIEPPARSKWAKSKSKAKTARQSMGSTSIVN